MGKIHERFKARDFRRPVARNQGISNYELLDAFEKAKSKFNGEIEVDSLPPDWRGKKKGHYQGLCNVTACQSPNQVEYYNLYTHAFYCAYCAHDINRSNARFKDVDNGAPFVNYMTPEEAKDAYVDVRG